MQQEPEGAVEPASSSIRVAASRMPAVVGSSCKRKRGTRKSRVAKSPPAPSEDDASDTDACIAFEGEEGLDISFPLKALEKSFRCSLCNGYFRCAVTIKECLHTFCRWCLFDYIEGGDTEGVCCPICEHLIQVAGVHRDGAGKDRIHYMARVTAACVASASGTGGVGGAGGGNSSVLFDRTVQNVVDKLFPDFSTQEMLEEEELNRFMVQHQHLKLPPALHFEQPPLPRLQGAVSLRKEAAAQRRARIEARAAAEALSITALVSPPLDIASPDPSPNSSESEETSPRRSNTKLENPLILRPPVSEFVEELLESSACLDDKQTIALALFPDEYRAQLLASRLQQRIKQQTTGRPFQAPAAPVVSLLGGASWSCLPLSLPRLHRPFLRVSSRIPVHLVARFAAAQLHLQLFGAAGERPPGDTATPCHPAEGPPVLPLELEMAMELTVEGKVLGKSHTLDFVRRTRRLNCVGLCLLLQYRYTSQAEAKLLADHASKPESLGASWGTPLVAAADPMPQ